MYIYTGFCYDTGVGVAKNEAEAARLFALAADKNHVASQYNLGNYNQLYNVPLHGL